MTSISRTAPLLAFVLALMACGDSHMVKDSDLQTLDQHIFVIPDYFSGQPYNYAQPTSVVYLDTNEAVKFWAGYSLNGTYLTTELSEDYYLSHSWIIDGEEYNISPLRYKFTKPGIRTAILETVDYLYDTLRDTVSIFVNTPVSINALFPVDGYNQVSPLPNSEQEIHWSLTGIDPWEDTRCNIYFSYTREEVWDNHLGTVNCDGHVTIVGSFLGDSLTQYIQKHPERDTSVSIYWGVKVASFTDDGFEERDSTAIFHFTTRYIHGDSAKITIPVYYENFHNASPYTRITLTNSEGDTLSLLTGRSNKTTYSVNVAAQTDIHIYVEDLSKLEYQPQSLVTSASAGTQTILDTIRLKDIIQPQVAILDEVPKTSDSLVFYALDNGSGINPLKILALKDGDTLDVVYEEPFIKFENTCIGECVVRVIAEDYAHNSSPNVFWKVSNKDFLYITGPYTDMGEFQ